jgi:hypothetical protein
MLFRHGDGSWFVYPPENRRLVMGVACEAQCVLAATPVA